MQLPFQMWLEGMSNLWNFAAAALFGFLGLMHLGYVVHDCLRPPRYFRPLDAALLAPLRNSKTALAPEGASYWAGVLGFHLSHCMGIFMFAVMIALSSTYAILWLQPVLIVVGISYAMVSYFCWFRVPTICNGIATVFLILGWWL
jgi:hypothetical protein